MGSIPMRGTLSFPLTKRIQEKKSTLTPLNLKEAEKKKMSRRRTIGERDSQRDDGDEGGHRAYAQRIREEQTLRLTVDDPIEAKLLIEIFFQPKKYIPSSRAVVEFQNITKLGDDEYQHVVAKYGDYLKQLMRLSITRFRNVLVDLCQLCCLRVNQNLTTWQLLTLVYEMMDLHSDMSMIELQSLCEKYITVIMKNILGTRSFEQICEALDILPEVGMNKQRIFMDFVRDVASGYIDIANIKKVDMKSVPYYQLMDDMPLNKNLGEFTPPSFSFDELNNALLGIEQESQFKKRPGQI